MPWTQWWSTPANDQKHTDNSLTENVKSTAHNVAQAAEQKLNNAIADHRSSASTITHSFSEPQTIIATVVLTTALLGCLKVYKTYLRRIPEATNIHQSYFRKRSVFGKVTSVGDGDNFRIFHTPGGRLAGWGWLPWRRVPVTKKLLKNQTVSRSDMDRLAGVDAPELAHFGRPSQPYSKEALEWLTSYVLGRRVRAYVHRPDQYGRVVATAYVWKGLLRRDIGLQMLRAGFATVYEAKTGVEFGKGLEQKYRYAEQQAKLKKKGMWSGDMTKYESPREYKNRYTIKEDLNPK